MFIVSKKPCSDTGNLKFSSEIWRHFDVEDDETICGLCRESIPPGLEEMKNHLEEKHSNVLDDVAQKVLDAASEEDNVLEDENMYTEIIYLEDETDKNIKQEKRQKRTRQQRSKVKSERKASTSSDEVLLKPKHRKYLSETNKEQPDELEPFINYITVLLKKVPKESSQKLHLDIINLIMNATQHQNNIITANINFNPANTNVSTIETVNFNNSNAVLDKSIVLTQTNTSDVNCMNTQRIAMPVQHFVTINDEKNTVPHVVTVSNTRMNNIN